MHHRSRLVALIILGTAIAVVSLMALVTAQPAKAQCGSQASSCKNCHETQGKDPVNSDGTGWHGSHAFGDFCYICHGGNQQATDETAAHAGMVAPMSDVQAACAQCHPNDLQARADVYAAKLGVTVSMSSQPPAQVSATATPQVAMPAADAAAPPAPSVASNSPDLVDYVTRYNQNVLHREPTNWGNVILLLMIGAMLVGGGALVVSREGLIKVSLHDGKPLEGEFPADVVDMVPTIARLKPEARRSLRRLLERPVAAAEVLTSIDRLSQGNSSEQDQQQGDRPEGSGKDNMR